MLFIRSKAFLGAILCAPMCSLQLASQSSAPPTAAATVQKARALYYTPVDRGLQGFHCEVAFDWKTFMQKATNQAIPDDDARLSYLRSIQLSVDDDLAGKGELHWTAPAPPPSEAEDSISRMRGGFQQIWSGFFESWNGFVTGNLVTLDAKASVESTADGYHVRVLNGPGTAEEQFSDKLILQQLHVATPTLDSVVMPSFAASPQGLLVTSLHSTYRQPPTAAPTEVLMQISYAPVGTFQLPSSLTVSVGPANFVWHLQNCTVMTKLTPK